MGETLGNAVLRGCFAPVMHPNAVWAKPLWKPRPGIARRQDVHVLTAGDKRPCLSKNGRGTRIVGAAKGSREAE